MDTITEDEWVDWCIKNEATRTTCTVREGKTIVSGYAFDTDFYAFELVEG